MVKNYELSPWKWQFGIRINLLSPIHTSNTF